MNRTNYKNKVNVKSICFTAIMAALVFVFTYTFKITFPSGYTHLGDCMIFLSLMILGRKRASLAAGIGAALADLTGGYAQWIIPSFIIKYLMVLACGLVMEKIIKNNKVLGLLTGGVIGGLLQIVLYTAVKIILVDKAYALTSLPRLAFQTVFGLVVAVILVFALDKTKTLDRLKNMAQ